MMWPMSAARAKTTIYLAPRQAKLLALIAEDQKATQAELIRRAIDQLIESTVLPLPGFVGIAVGEGPGTPIDPREMRREWGDHLEKKYHHPRRAAESA
jgi:hypothetical protein